jgi:hypothetical protein
VAGGSTGAMEKGETKVVVAVLFTPRHEASGARPMLILVKEEELENCFMRENQACERRGAFARLLMDGETHVC